MSQIFLSYRRDDTSAATGRIYDRLKLRFGETALFRDLDSIQLGVDFADRISSALDHSAVQLVLIGPRWLTIPDAAGERRLDKADDVVRMEVAAALQSGIPVIPICIDDAAFPTADQLPSDLQKLARQNGVAVRNGADFENDMGRVITRILDCLAAKPLPADPYPAGILPASLAQLGFIFRHLKHTDFIVPPTREVTAGQFQMGHATFESESPPHTVALKGFAIGAYPVTVAEYACFVRTVHHPPLTNDLAWQDQLERPDHPVVNVAWQDAVAYAAWLSKLTGQGWRLPTEAEWERAAKWNPATSEGHTFPWGGDFGPERCNTRTSGARTTSAIGDHADRGRAPCGACDMAGNVWEWTSTLYRDYKYSAGDGREKMDAPGTRVCRGGSWDSVPSNARTTKRAWNMPETWRDTLGFRLAVGAGARG